MIRELCGLAFDLGTKAVSMKARCAWEEIAQRRFAIECGDAIAEDTAKPYSGLMRPDVAPARAPSCEKDARAGMRMLPGRVAEAQ